jgi:hypothetical protein
MKVSGRDFPTRIQALLESPPKSTVTDMMGNTVLTHQIMAVAISANKTVMPYFCKGCHTRIKNLSYANKKVDNVDNSIDNIIIKLNIWQRLLCFHLKAI